MDLLTLLFLSLGLSCHCIIYSRSCSLLNFSNINTTEITVRDSNHTRYQEHEYTPKSGVLIFKVTDGFGVVWEDKQKLTNCIGATTLTKNHLIQLIHLRIKRSSKIVEDKFYKRLESKFVNISDKEYGILKLDTDQLTDNSIYFDINSKEIDEHLFKNTIRPFDGVPTLLLQPLPSYRLVAIYDDFRTVWSKKSTQVFVEKLIAYYFFTKYYLVMLNVNVKEESKYLCFMFKDGNWLEVEYYTFMNKFLRLKSHIPITGHLSFDILNLPDDQEYSIEKDEKYSIELATYYPRRGFVLNSVLKGEHIIWESATERCVSIRLVKKKGTVYGINLSLNDDRENHTTLNFIFDDYVFKNVTDEEFKEFGKKLVDPSDYQKYREEHAKNEPPKTREESEVIVEEPEGDQEEQTQAEAQETHIPEETEAFQKTEMPEESYIPKETTTPQGSPRRREPPESNDREDSTESNLHEEDTSFGDSEPQLLDISSYNSRVFMRNSFNMDNVDTFEFLPMPKVKVSSIIDGSIVIWENFKQSHSFSKLFVHHRNDLSQLLKLVTFVKSGEVYTYFKRHNAGFLTIPVSDYESFFEKMGNSINLLDNSILLNLSTTPQEKYFDYYNEYDDGVNISKLITRSTFKLSKIIDGQHVLWHSANNESCSSVSRNRFYKNSELLVLNFSGLFNFSTKFFKKTDEGYSEIDQSTYNSDYKSFKDLIPFISNVSLNINSTPGEVNFLYNESVEGKFTHGKYYPKSGYVLNKVSSGSNVLWTSTKNRCKQVSVLSGPNSKKLVRLLFSNSTLPELYFNLVNGKFVKLRNFIEFDFTLKEYNKPESDVDPCAFCKSQLEREFLLTPDVHKIYLNTNIDASNTYTCFESDLVMNKIFVPKDGNVFTNITDGNVILFNSKSDFNLCVYIQVFYGNGSPRLAKLRTLPIETSTKGSLSYLEVCDVVKNISPDEFKVKLTELTNELNLLNQAQNKIPLNISLSSTEYTERDDRFRGLNYKEFRAKEGYFFSKIIFSNDLVYSLDSDEDCISVRIYFFFDFPYLVELEFALVDSKNTKLYLYRYSNDFTSLDLEHFNNLLRSISDFVSKCVILELGDFNSTSRFEMPDPETNSDCKLNHKLFSSSYIYFTAINSRDLLVWSVTSDLFFAKDVKVHYLNNSPYLIKILLQNLDKDETNLFYEFHKNAWRNINYTEYTNKLNKHSRSGEDESKGAPGVFDLFDVDITKNINPDHVSYVSSKANGVIFVEASLKDDADGIRSVSNNGKLMWKSSTQDSVCKNCFVYYFDGIPQLLKLVLLSESDTECFIYKHVSNGYWVEIDDDIFTRKLASFEYLSKVNVDPEPTQKVVFKLDTSNIDKSRVRFTQHQLKNLPYNQYKPIGKGSFSEVIDGSSIWKSESDFECNLVRIYLSKNSPVLCKLFLSNDLGVDKYLYFSHAGGNWNKMSSSDFESELEDLTRDSEFEKTSDSASASSVAEEFDHSSVQDETPVDHIETIKQEHVGPVGGSPGQADDSKTINEEYIDQLDRDFSLFEDSETIRPERVDPVGRAPNLFGQQSEPEPDEILVENVETIKQERAEKVGKSPIPSGVDETIKQERADPVGRDFNSFDDSEIIMEEVIDQLDRDFSSFDQQSDEESDLEEIFAEDYETIKKTSVDSVRTAPSPSEDVGTSEHEPVGDDHPIQQEYIIRTIDLNSLDSDLCTFVNGTHFNTPYTLINVKPKVLIKEIMDNDSVVWSNSGEKHCIRAKIYRFKETGVLGQLVIKSKASKLVFVKRVADSWQVVDEDDFNENYGDLLNKCSSS
ncbi:hypothetical protein TpMuguga_02g00019 [Theileria parva strain Muguga]|uniref:Uncharacterized protein n=1 Tax=Theileria parva TaxID=5875 RepID=Q4N6B8_THEPA|nr:uncharacterized protein TpMuguga_02g00019 [Theileria parva strain Muguga]EAN32305.1 hypothetical protein TpMuguga_02g00019 [Theileria parva strain Muguga]|eukprot:XP_764588.1 hypothetical protein [Theileria parva strain Muguga]